MKDHPTPTPEQMGAAEELVRRLNFCEDDELDDIEHFDAEVVAQTFAQREAQAEKRGAEKVWEAYKNAECECEPYTCTGVCENAANAARKVLEDL